MKIQKLKGTVKATLKACHDVEITHSGSVRLSKNYQSAETSYGIKLHVEDTPEAIKKGQKRAENLVEQALVKKVKEYSTLLDSLSKT